MAPKTRRPAAKAIAAPVDEESRLGARLGFLIHDLSRMRRRAYDQFVKPLGMTRAQWWVLAYLSRRDGMTQTALADTLEVSKSSVGEVLLSLESGGWVQRHALPSDKRSKRVFLTTPARGFISKMFATEVEFNNLTMGVLSHEEKLALAELLARLKAAVANLDPDEASAP